MDRKASERLRAEALKRADRLLKAARQEGAGGGGGGAVDFGLLSDVGATAAGGADQSSGARSGALRRRAAVAGRQDNPEVYIEARHAQVGGVDNRCGGTVLCGLGAKSRSRVAVVQHVSVCITFCTLSCAAADRA